MHFNKKQITKSILRKNYNINRIDMKVKDQNKKSQKQI